MPAHQVRIVDTGSREVGERVEGRLEFKGPSATSGYYRNPAGTQKLMDGDWLDSGDRAYTADGEIHLTGRVKDIIIRGGRNIYPHELEDAVGAIPGVRRGCVAVFGQADASSGTERLVVLAETRLTGTDDAQAREALRARIVETSLAALGEAPDEVVLAPPHTVLKTSSGKIRRAACRELHASGRIGARAPPAWWQAVRLVAGSLGPQLHHRATATINLIYGLYVALLFGLIAPATWLLTAATPRPALAWRVNRLATRTFLGLCGIRLTVRGLEHLPRAPCVLVANHASYLDTVVLCAAIPIHFAFVAKRELLDHPISRIYLRRLGTQFVERFDARQSVADARRLGATVKAGVSSGFFPEGTFTRAAGLGPFRLGAFMAAAAAGVVVLPVAIRGARTVLRDGEWLARRGPIEVNIGRPVPPSDSAPDEFTAAVALRDAARAHILAHCGEPDSGAR